MKNGVLKFYLLAVCFVALICGAISLDRGLNEFVTWLAPELTLNSHVYNRHKSLESFHRPRPIAGIEHLQAFSVVGAAGLPRPLLEMSAINGADRHGGSEAKVLSDSEVDTLRIKSLNAAIDSNRRDALLNLIDYGIVFFIALCLLIIHWRIVAKVSGAEACTEK
ncbi:MAG: hypothetical protein JKX92_02685 [Porticoccaceae bacterium]|nr:hypothetical protein [Porticoccaceae bacterium]